MNVAIVIVLSSIFNLLSCAKLDRNRNRAATSMPTPSTEFLSSSTAFPSLPRLATVLKNTRNINMNDSELRDAFVDDSLIMAENQDNDDVSEMDGKDSGEPPHFVHPDNLTPFLMKPSGNMVRITCKAAGNPVPNITWTKDSNEIVRTNGKVVRKKWSIVLEDLTQKDSGVYACKVCNLHGCISHTTNLKVQERVNQKPILLEPPQNSTNLVGTSHTIECKFISDLHSNIQWLYFGECLNCSEPKIIQTDLENPEDLTLHNITHNDAGWYTCIAANSLGRTVASAYLHVVDVLPPQPISRIDTKNARNADEATESIFDESMFTTENQDNEDVGEMDVKDTGDPPSFMHPDNLPPFLARPSGNMVRIICKASGNPVPNITWTKDSNEIVRTHGKVVRKKWSIVLEDLTQKDSGAYTCTVCNLHGCISHTTNLKVQERVNRKPILSEPPQNSTILVGTSPIIKCKFISDLHLNIQWLYFVECLNCSEPKIIQTDIENPEELILHNITHNDAGWYTCIAANSLGYTAASAYLHVVDDMEEISPINKGKFHFDSLLGYVIILSMGGLFLVAIFIMLIGFKKLKREKMEKHRAMETVHQWTKKVIIVKPSDNEVDGGVQIPIVRIEKQRTTLLQSQYCNDPSLFNEYEFPLDSNREFPRNHLKFGPTLGEGEFGRVVMAEAYGLVRPQENQIVAVKMVKEGHTDSDVASLVREMEVMKMIGKHINIINLLGCCSQEGPLYVIVEYAPHGNLKDFLKKNLAMSDYNSLNTSHLLTQKELTSFAYQVARGMEYLASRRYIHRDLAARNVLVCDNYVVKIADFGLARDLQESDYYRKSTNGRLPFKWMAPESFWDKFYDSQSDVWSYGVLLWEIMTFGEQPYPQICFPKQLYDYLYHGNRMEKPMRCPINIYALMRQCWNFEGSHDQHSLKSSSHLRIF